MRSVRLRVAFLSAVLAVLFVGCGFVRAATAEAPATGPSGLDWPSGVHAANELGPHLAFGDWRGRPIDVLHTFTNYQNWEGMIGAEPYMTWHRAFYSDKKHTYVISQPPYPRGQGNNAACARGEYNQQWQQFGKTLVQHGLDHHNTVIRIAWEFNGDYMYWTSGPTPGDFIKCWRNVAQNIKAVAPNIRTDWTLNGHGWGANLGGNMYNAYPGDDVVDIVGMDEYDHYPSVTSDAEFDTRCNKAGGSGVCDLARFAREHHKQLSVGEWSVTGGCSGSARTGKNGGDNPLFIRRMAQFFHENRDILAYESYYDDPMLNNVCSTLYRKNVDQSVNQQASTEYKKWFGAASPYVATKEPVVPPPTPPKPRVPTELQDNTLVLSPANNAVYYIKGGTKTWLQNSALVGCVSYRGAGTLIRNVPQQLIDKLPSGHSDYCTYETEPGINFVQERDSPYIWLVRPGGTMLQVGAACVPDAYSTPLKKFRIHVVANGEVAGHTKVGSFFGAPGICGKLPG